MNAHCKYLSNRAFPRFRVSSEDFLDVTHVYILGTSLRRFLTFSANTNLNLKGLLRYLECVFFCKNYTDQASLFSIIYQSHTYDKLMANRKDCL